MKDQLVLLVAAVVCVALAWVFFHYLGQDAWAILSAVVIVALTADNVRLRRTLKRSRHQ